MHLYESLRLFISFFKKQKNTAFHGCQDHWASTVRTEKQRRNEEPTRPTGPLNEFVDIIFASHQLKRLLTSSHYNMTTINDPTSLQQDSPPSTPASYIVKPANDETLPSKSAAEYYGYGDCSPSAGSPLSLNRLMAGRKPMRSPLFSGTGMKGVSFSGELDYGYGEGAVEPPNKKRRYQRRNSKTPAMLMLMKNKRAPLINLDFLHKLDTEKKSSEEKSKSSSPTDCDGDDDNWESGLEIAEELVKHLRSRRRSSANSSPSHADADATSSEK